MKKLLLLGGARYLLPVIQTAHEMGIYVITCDYLPDNIAHRYSDEYHNVSIVDKEAVLALAKQLQIDGILSFATDPGVVTCAYVAEKMGLPGSPYESVKILQNKDLFRAFLSKNGFNVPKHKAYTDAGQALKEARNFNWPVVVKPVDSAGSKGVTRVDDLNGFSIAVNCALEHSLSGRFIVEEFIEQDGFASSSDCFSVNNSLVFASFDCQYFDKNAENPYTPSAHLWPSSMPLSKQRELRCEIERLIKLLHMGTSIYNIETRVGVNGKAYIMECSPRGGGNRLAEMLKISTGVDLIRNNICGALGLPISKMIDPSYNGVWAEYIVHSYRDGIFDEVHIDKDFETCFVKQKDIWFQPGDVVHAFSGANEMIGSLVLKFDTRENAMAMLAHPEQWIDVRIKEKV